MKENSTMVVSEQKAARAWAEIDLSALRHNYQILQSTVGDGTGLLAVLKANAYGHGAVECAKELEAAGAKAIGVATLEEGLEMQSAGVTCPLVVLGALMDEEIEAAVACGIEFCVFSDNCLSIASRSAESNRTSARVHVMVDTGMGRIGIAPEEITPFLLKVVNAKSVKLVGLATHFSSAGDADAAFTQSQIERFAEARAAVDRLGISDVVCHASNHTALIRYPEARLDMVRPGLALFGLQLAGPDHKLGLQRVLSLRASILHIKEVEAGTPISYSRLWAAPKRSKIATVSIGYNDGFRVGLTGKSSVLVGGVRCPVVGRVTMDYIMVDVSELPAVERGDVVTLIGRDGDQEIKLEELSNALGTVPYEVTCGIGKRVARRIVSAGAACTQDGLRLVA